MRSNISDRKTLALTARWTASARAHESKRGDRLFNDPYAEILAGKEGREWFDRMSKAQDGGNFLAIRTRFFDDFLLRATIEQQARQVILVAAGMDTRGFRLSWRSQTKLFELDQPKILEEKDQILYSIGAKPSCWRKTVGVDLMENSWTGILQNAGFDARQVSVWLMEGLLNYLPESAVMRLLDLVTAQAVPGSWLGLDVINRETLSSHWTRSMIKSLENAGVPYQFAIDEPEKLLAKRGWSATVFQPGDEGANFNRWPYPVMPRSVAGFPRGLFVTAKRITPQT
jgi:methyltransferase (TIGR00027 family)